MLSSWASNAVMPLPLTWFCDQAMIGLLEWRCPARMASKLRLFLVGGASQLNGVYRLSFADCELEQHTPVRHACPAQGRRGHAPIRSSNSRFALAHASFGASGLGHSAAVLGDGGGWACPRAGQRQARMPSAACIQTVHCGMLQCPVETRPSAESEAQWTVVR